MDGILSWDGLMAVLPYLMGVIAIILVAFIYWLMTPLMVAYKTKRSPDYDVEKFFTDEDGAKRPFPSITDAPSVLVSVVVPAYNESKRIDPMMTEMLSFLNGKSKADKAFTWEIVVVDDGSKDNTSEHVYNNYVKKLGSDKLRLCTLFKNNGKGGAVRKGMLRARGQYIIFADADGATKASDLTNLLSQLKTIENDGMGIAIGSRAHLESEGAGEAKATRTPLRKMLMFCFHMLITLLVGGHGIEDTQCGFKMFTRAAVRRIFPVQHIERWAFDVELLYLAARFGIPMIEVPVTWHEVDGSTLDPLTAALQMARDIFIIRLAYALGIWTYSADSVTLKAETNAVGSGVTSPAASVSSSAASLAAAAEPVEADVAASNKGTARRRRQA